MKRSLRNSSAKVPARQSFSDGSLDELNELLAA